MTCERDVPRLAGARTARRKTNYGRLSSDGGNTPQPPAGIRGNHNSRMHLAEVRMLPRDPAEPSCAVRIPKRCCQSRCSLPAFEGSTKRRMRMHPLPPRPPRFCRSTYLEDAESHALSGHWLPKGIHSNGKNEPAVFGSSLNPAFSAACASTGSSPAASSAAVGRTASSGITP
jgi:hypothetical protein